jgi:hypothetical protein
MSATMDKSSLSRFMLIKLKDSPYDEERIDNFLENLKKHCPEVTQEDLDLIRKLFREGKLVNKPMSKEDLEFFGFLT